MKHRDAAEREALAAKMLRENPSQPLGLILAALRREFGQGIGLGKLYDMRRAARKGVVSAVSDYVACSGCRRECDADELVDGRCVACEEKPQVAKPAQATKDGSADEFKTLAKRMWALAQERGYTTVHLAEGKMQVTRVQTVTVGLG